MSKIKLKIATPERVVLEEEIDQITLPTSTGEITILPNHLPIVTSLKSGEILAKKDGADLPLATSGGFVEFADNELTILADTAERVEEIDETRAEEARARAAKLLEQQHEKSEIDFTAMAAKLEKELARLKVSQKYKHLKRSGPQIQIMQDEENH